MHGLSSAYLYIDKANTRRKLFLLLFIYKLCYTIPEIVECFVVEQITIICNLKKTASVI